MREQLSFFQETEPHSSPCFYRNIEQSGFNYQEVNIGDITFKSGQSESVHRWFRLTPSFSPNLVRFLFKELGVSQDDFLLDPFSGRGTTIIECQKFGIRASGVEINPLLQQVGNRSLIWEIEHLNLLDSYTAQLRVLLDAHQPDSLEAVLEKFNTRLPLIHNVFRWWKPHVLRDLLICRELMSRKRYAPVLDYLWLAVNKAALDCANIHRNHPTITFDDDHQRNIDVYFEVSQNLGAIGEDLRSLDQKQISYSKLNTVIVGDSTQDLRSLIDRRVDYIITSPPYPNRYSYVHQTRPQLHFMELLEDIRQATEIDLRAIGGTWGKATSVLQKELIEPPSDIKPYLSYYDALKGKSTLMCNYATKYFVDLWRHIRAVRASRPEGLRCAYVVGNSRLSGVEIFTEVILGKIFEHEGFEVEKIISFRKRGGRQRLYETAVCVKS